MGAYANVPSFLHPQTRAVRIFRQTCEQRVHQTTHHAHGRLGARVAVQRTTESLKAFETVNAYFLNADAIQRVVWILMPCSLLAINGIDLALFRPVAHYLARRMVSSQFLLGAISLFVPMAILVLDLGLGVLRYYYAELGNRFWSVFWTSLGILLALFMPLAAVATQLGALFLAREGIAWGMQLVLLVVLAVLSLVCHALLVFAGHPLFEAKAYWISRWHQRSLRGAHTSAERAFVNRGIKMGEWFGRYSREINGWNSQNPQMIVELDLFDRVTREELRDWFGYVVVQLPSQPGDLPLAPVGARHESTPSPAASAGSVVPAPTGPAPPIPSAADATPADTHAVADWETEYLRNILSQSPHEKEEESVRP
jgi:hypothetical protein